MHLDNISHPSCWAESEAACGRLHHLSNQARQVAASCCWGEEVLYYPKWRGLHTYVNTSQQKPYTLTRKYSDPKARRPKRE